MKNKSKAKLIAIIITIFVAFTVILFLFFKTDIFRTKRSAFLRYFEYIPSALDIVTDTTFEKYNELKKTTPYIRKGEAIIQSSSNIADTSILDKIKISIDEKADYKNEISNIQLSIKNSKNELANITGVRSKNVFGMYCPLVANGYISIKNENLREIFTAFGAENSEKLSNEIVELKKDKIFKISKNEKKHILNTCKILKEDVPDTAYTKESSKRIKIDDKTFSTTAYTLNLDEKQNANLQISLLENISQDSILMNYITSKCKLLNMNEKLTDINTLNTEMKNRIQELKSNPSVAKELTMTIYEYRQKNLRTELKIGDDSITIDHITDNDIEETIITYNEKSIKLKKQNGEYYIKLEEKADIEKSLEITYSQSGTIESNNIQNIMKITSTNGIKSITYAYNDQINFTNEIGIINGFENSKNAILNDYDKNEVKEFIKSLKKKINQVYVNKGASIGINLDPIFENE